MYPSKVSDPSKHSREIIPGGYVLLAREMMNPFNSIWCSSQPLDFKVAMYLLVRANWNPGVWHPGSELIHIARGELITSLQALVRDIPGTTMKKIRASLDRLRKCGFLGTEKGRPYTRIKVLNYDYYQDPSNYETHKRADMQAGFGHDQGTKRATIEEGKEGKEGSDRLELHDKLRGQYGLKIVDACTQRLEAQIEKGVIISNPAAYLSEACSREALKLRENTLEREAAENKKHHATEANEAFQNLETMSREVSTEDRQGFAEHLRNYRNLRTTVQ